MTVTNNYQPNMNHYDILGLTMTASQEEIRAAYKKLAKEFHPDKHNGSEAYYEEKFKQVNSAYQTLSNPARRSLYDLKLRYRASGTSTSKDRKSPGFPSFHKANQQKKAKAAHEARMRKEKERRKERKIWWISGAGFLVFMVVCVFFYNYMNHYSAELSLNKGLEAEKEKRYMAAMELYSQALDYDDKFGEAWKRRADLKLKAFSNYRSALPDYSAAIRYSSPNHWNTFYRRAKCCFNMELYEQAAQDLDQAISLNHANDSIYFLRAEINAFKLHHYKTALDDYDLIISRNPSFPDARYGRALANMGLGFYQKCTDELSLLIAIEPEEGKHFFWRAFSKISMGDSTGACRDWEKSKEMDIEGSEEQLEKYCRR
ncbi:MAG: DnaJ domain-containing protein [Cytophagaceae bacterium]